MRPSRLGQPAAKGSTEMGSAAVRKPTFSSSSGVQSGALDLVHQEVQRIRGMGHGVVDEAREMGKGRHGAALTHGGYLVAAIQATDLVRDRPRHIY